MHNKRVSANRANLDRVNSIADLYRYHCANNETSIPLEDFITSLSNDKDFEDNLLNSLAKNLSGASPLDEVNAVLKEYKFSYCLISKNDPHKRDRTVIKLKRIESLDRSENGTVINPASLSSGERMILTVMSWLYCKRDLEQHKATVMDTEKIKILLLDEADRHLDPKLCKLFFEILQKEFVEKHGIQVILSTHRFDSIAYAKKGSIYVLRGDKAIREIVPSARMEAIFRMTSNIRELTAYERRVYTESLLDAQFYEGVYHTLIEWCSKNKEGIWYPSRRHPLSFHAVSTPDLKDDKKSKRNKSGGKGNGGSTKVVSRVKEDNGRAKARAKISISESSRVTLRWNRAFGLIDEPDLLMSYGILDLDYEDNTRKLAEKKSDLESIVILQRYGLENFCLDPVIFCSVLNNIEHYVNGIESIRGEEYIHIRTKLVNVCGQIQSLLENGDIQEIKNNLQLFVSEYFLILLPIVAIKILKKDIYHKDQDKRKNRDKNQDKNREICNDIFKVTALIPAGLIEVDWNSPRKEILEKFEEKFKEKFGNKENFESYLREISLNSYSLKEIRFIKKDSNDFYLNYPKIFLEVHDHILESIFDWDCKPTDEIAKKVQYDGLDYIPEDLKLLFEEIDKKIRNNVHTVTKPYFSNPCSLFGKRENVSNLKQGISELTLSCSSSSSTSEVLIDHSSRISSICANQFHANPNETKEYGNYLKITKEIRGREIVYEFNLTDVWQNLTDAQKQSIKEAIKNLYSKNRSYTMSNENIIKISFLKEDAQILLDKLKEVLFFDDSLLPGEMLSPKPSF